MRSEATRHHAASEPRQRLSVAILNWRDTGHPEGGGSEVFVERTAAGLVALGHRVTILCAEHAPAPAQETRPDGVRIVRRGGRFGVYWHARRAMRRGLLGDPDVIVEVHNGVPFLARLWARCTPVVVVVHHVHREQWRVLFDPVRARIGWWLESWLAPRVNRGSHYVTVSDATRRELTGLGVSREAIEVVHNGTDLPVYKAVAKTDHPSLLVLGRLVPHKRVEIAMETVARLLREFPDLTLTVAGHGWWEGPLRSRAAALDIADRVEFTGHVDEHERDDLYARSWVALVPSLKEGWGLVVVEAGVHGTPSIAFHGAGGLDESIIDEATGLLVTHDDVDAFVAATRRLLTDHELRARLGADAAIHARRFTWDETAKTFAELLETAARAARR